MGRSARRVPHRRRGPARVNAVRAELNEDAGAACFSGEFFRSRPFLEAEGATHTLKIESDQGQLLAPLIVREIPGTADHDGVSPYGYPGLSAGGWGDPVRTLSRRRPVGVPPTPATTLDPSQIAFPATGLVSIFTRHTLGPPPLANATERNIVQIADPALPPKSRPSDRRQVRRNLEAGYTLDLVPGAETTSEQRAGFNDLYEQTMQRNRAAEHYFFGAAYFDRILDADRTWLALAVAPEGELAAASIAAVSDGYLHYYLSGSADPHLRSAP